MPWVLPGTNAQVGTLASSYMSSISNLKLRLYYVIARDHLQLYDTTSAYVK